VRFGGKKKGEEIVKGFIKIGFVLLMVFLEYYF
jgi:hypothetical protein